ncbi:FapA family protein [Desulfospira joergensenii]|uniref:FapA family protein n=1 Tax=Desulfospira joergensenii TaxID=53329 RepID=UPI0003B50B0F|nr:FapA family protein [Desulfospira joergensenii]
MAKDPINIEPGYKEHKILVIDSGDTLKQKIKYLCDRGYRVDCVHEPSQAFEKLIKSKQTPYSLIIAVYMHHRMKGDKTLEKAKEIAPDTQRILIAGQSDFQLFVHAINSADIHACMPLPFTDEELFYQVKLRCSHYETIRKLQKLQTTTQRQNDQLHQIAESFKKKETLYSAQSDKQEKEIRILESRFKSAFGLAAFDENIGLKDILHKKNVHFNPMGFDKAFLDIKEQINQVLKIILTKHGFSLPSLPWETLLADAPDTREYQPLPGQALALFLKLIDYKEVQSTKIYEDVRLRDFSKYFSLRLSDDKIKAHISLESDAPDTLALFHVKRFLEIHRIIFGVKPDHLIEAWLYDEDRKKEPFLIAHGNEPRPPKNARIDYYFPIDFLHAGKINPDGSIDFRDRGDTPHVGEDELLASKVYPEEGRVGISVGGEKIPVEEPVDWGFSSGAGTRISDEGDKIYSLISGQPHLDPMGIVSVCTEYQIQGDIGFETGNIEFDGNVVITGSVKQGFKVKCTSLTAKEISGGEIDVSGDLNVSMGIIDTRLVNVRGSVQAKFIRNSKIYAFGDVIVQKEIIDSEIYLSGACVNEKGLILNSRISAKMGIRGGTIGNKSSQPSILTVGVDEHTNLLVEKIESRLALAKEKIRQLTDEILQLENENQELHALISKNAHIQDRSQLEIIDLEEKKKGLKIRENRSASKEVTDQIQELSQKAKKAEDKIDLGFERQDEISLIVSEKQVSVEEMESLNKNLMEDKKRLLERSSIKEPLPEVTVSRHMESRTRIFTGKTSKTLSQSLSRCRIREISRSFDRGKGPSFYEINIENW